MEYVAGDYAQAWNSLTLLSARTRGLDPSVEHMLVLTQRALNYDISYTDERRQLTVAALRAPVEAAEQRLIGGLAARPDSLHANDGFVVRWYWVPARATAHANGPAPAPLLLVLAPGDSLVAADSLAAAFAAAGRSVVLLPPRGTGAALGPGAYGPRPGPAGRPRSPRPSLPMPRA